MMGMIGETWASAGSAIATLMFIWAMVDRYIPPNLKNSFARYFAKLTKLFNPYTHITIPEYGDDFWTRNEAYIAVEAYLTATSSTQAKNLKAEIIKPNQNISLTIDTYEEVTDVFNGAKLWWLSGTTGKSNSLSFSWYPDREEKKFYCLTYRSSDRGLVTEAYLPHVIDEGNALAIKNRRKKLYTNNAAGSSDVSQGRLWSSVVFDHPATFETLAMDPVKKKEVIDDLSEFRKRKAYYSRIGKAWKRGYLLYGPPGTGKSSMIAAIANFLDYDVYDLELTAVSDNTELRKLLFDTSSKSIIVIEDIDCSLDLAGKRAKKDDKLEEEEPNRRMNGKEKKQVSKVTLSGLLNFIDGLWSACGGERIIVFTTNFIEKLDPALIRRGRMDVHVELSYCSFGGFRVLAKNYLGIEGHYMFEKIRELIEDVKITPADVAENLMPKSVELDVEACLGNLVAVLCKLREDGMASSDKEDETVSKENEVEDNNGSEDRRVHVIESL